MIIVGGAIEQLEDPNKKGAPMASFEPHLAELWTARRLRQYANVFGAALEPLTLTAICDAPILAPSYDHRTSRGRVQLTWVDAPTSRITSGYLTLTNTAQRALEVAIMEVLCRYAMVNHQAGIAWNIPLAMQGLRALVDLDGAMDEEASAAMIVELITTTLPDWLETHDELAAMLIRRIKL